MADDWDAVLDDLESRLAAAEAGDLTGLQGWSAPSPTGRMGPDHVARARSLVRRQERFAEQLRARQAAVGRLLRGTRRPRFAVPSAPPAYVDRTA